MAKLVLCEAAAVPEGTCKSFISEGRRIALYNVGGSFYATQDICLHKADCSERELSMDRSSRVRCMDGGST